MSTLRDFFKEPDELLRLEPEELGGIVLEVAHDPQIGVRFQPIGLIQQLHRTDGTGWDHRRQAATTNALYEALAWLVSQGLAMRDPSQSGEFYVLTRRGAALKNSADAEAYRRGGALPIQLLQPALAEKVHHLFVRGDHDTAVFQAFKEVEVAVRRAARLGDDLVGHKLIAKAFAVDDGPLADLTMVAGERLAEFYLFAGAIGHCKNPTSHRDVNLRREEAARLIVFASHLLAIVHERAPESLAGW